MNTKEEVIIFLEGVRKFLYGDLSNFDRLCKEAERLEKIGLTDPNGENLNYTSSYNPNIANTSTTTTQTTLSPNSAESLDDETIFFRSTIPHILTILATADLVGFLLGSLEVKPPNTVENMKKFFSESISEAEIEYLTFFYRHGMAHSFFPKNKMGVKAHSLNPENKLFFLENDTIVLNANYLIELTKQGLEVVLGDQTLHTNMKEQFLKLKNHDNKKIKNLQPDIETFKKGLLKI